MRREGERARDVEYQNKTRELIIIIMLNLATYNNNNNMKNLMGIWLESTIILDGNSFKSTHISFQIYFCFKSFVFLNVFLSRLVILSANVWLVMFNYDQRPVRSIPSIQLSGNMMWSFYVNHISTKY